MEKRTMSAELQRTLEETDLTVADCRTVVFTESASSGPSFYSHVAVWWCALGKVRLRHEGLSPGAYMAGLQIRKADRLLGDCALSIDDIARRCGFKNAAAFSKFFKRNTGISPDKEHRRRIRMSRSGTE